MHSRSRRTAAVAALLFLTAAACSDSPTGLPQSVASVLVSPSQHSLIVGETVQLTAAPRAADGRQLTGPQVTWSTSDALVATVTAQGLVEAKGQGPVTISATVEGKTGRAQIAVSSIPIATLTANVSELTLEEGDTYALVATPKDAAGNVLADRVCIWQSSDPIAATITPTGLQTATVKAYHAVANPVMLVVRCEGKQVEAPLRITARAVAAHDLIYHRQVNGRYELALLSLAGNGVPQRIDVGSIGGNLGAFSPTARPDGGRIAFSAFAEQSRAEIFVVDRDGGTPTRLTNALEGSSEAVWSPDGTKIAFVRSSGQGVTYDVWVMNADGTNQVNLTADASASIDNRMPTWSPDSKSIAFARSENVAFNDPGPFGIWVMNASDGSGKRRLVPGGYFDLWPSWSPDGQRIAFVRHDAAHGADLTIVNVDGTGLRRIAVPDYDESPVWSPDGALIAFANRDPVLGRMEIYTVRADGSDVRRRTTSAEWGGGSAPAWIARR